MPLSPKVEALPTGCAHRHVAHLQRRVARRALPDPQASPSPAPGCPTRSASRRRSQPRRPALGTDSASSSSVAPSRSAVPLPSVSTSTVDRLSANSASPLIVTGPAVTDRFCDAAAQGILQARRKPDRQVRRRRQQRTRIQHVGRAVTVQVERLGPVQPRKARRRTVVVQRADRQRARSAQGRGVADRALTDTSPIFSAV